MSHSVISKNVELEKYLKQNNSYSFARLKENLDLKKDSEFLNFLICFEAEKIKDFSYNKDINSQKYLLKLNRYYHYSLGKIDISENDDVMNIVNNLKKLKEIVDSKIQEFHKLPTGINSFIINNREENLFLLHDISDGIDSAINKLRDEVNLTDEVYNFDHKQLVNYLIYDLKNNEYLKILFNKYPELIYLKNDDGNYVFDEIIVRYFNSLLNSSDHYNHMFFNKLIDLYLFYDKDGLLKDDFYIKTNKFLMSIDSKNIDADTNKRIVASISERIRKSRDKELDFVRDSSERAYFERIDFDKLKPFFGDREDFLLSDFRYRYTFTLDSDDAKVLEQAISIQKKGGKYLLSIYVPDVVDSIAENKNFEKNHYQRSINEPSKSKRIFPSSISKNNFSLDEGVERRVFAYQFLIDKDLNCYNVDFRRAKIIVNDNIFIKDFNGQNEFKSKNNKYINSGLNDGIQNLLDLVLPGVKINDIDGKTVNIINSVINGFAMNYIISNCRDLGLPLIFLRTDFNLINSNIENIKVFNNLKMKGYLNTICNDGIYDEDNLSMSLFSPLRKVSSLVNQMLVCIYFVNHNTEFDPYTLNYLESRLDEVTSNINNIDKLEKNDIKSEKKAKVLGEIKNEK